MPSRTKAVLILNSNSYTGGQLRGILNDFRQSYGLFLPEKFKTARESYGWIVKKLREDRLVDDIKLLYFRENRFQNPYRSEFAALVSKEPKKRLNIRPPRAAPRWARNRPAVAPVEAQAGIMMQVDPGQGVRHLGWAPGAVIEMDAENNPPQFDGLNGEARWL